MRYDLRAMTKRARQTRRKSITFRAVTIPSTSASDLYAGAYAPVIAAWTEAIDLILAAYERALSAMTTDSPADVGRVVEQREGVAFRVALTIRARLEQWAMRLEALHRRKWRAAVLIATSIDIGTMIGAGDMRMPIAASIERNVSLVKSVSEQARTRIGDAVFRGLTRRAPAAEVAKEIRDAVAMSRRRAMNIAADQMVKLASALNEERRREAGIATWEWMHSGKAHPREEHKARNGKRYSDDDPPADMPGELPFCGCTSRAVLDMDGEF